MKTKFNLQYETEINGYVIAVSIQPSSKQASIEAASRFLNSLKESISNDIELK